MDQEKTGKFISESRKAKGLTQSQLASMLGITDKAVSKWETARSFPDAGIINPLCEILGITVSELFAGERIKGEEALSRSEDSLISAAGELNKKEKRFRTFFAIGMAMVVLSVLVDEYLRGKWLLLACYIIVLSVMKFSLREEKIYRIVSLVSSVALMVSVIFSADLLLNYLYGIYDAALSTEGIRMYGLLGRLIWGDSMWSVEGYLKAFEMSVWVTVILFIENTVLKFIHNK